MIENTFESQNAQNLSIVADSISEILKDCEIKAAFYIDKIKALEDFANKKSFGEESG